MSIHKAIQNAEAVLPGTPADGGKEDERWQAIIAIGEYVETEPQAVWEFIKAWGNHPQEDLRNAIATCLLEHLLEHHFSTYFPQVESVVISDSFFADTFLRCWKFGESAEPGNAQRFDQLSKRLSPNK